MGNLVVQKALVYVVMQVTVYEKTVMKFHCSFLRWPYPCFNDGPRH